MQNKTLEEVLTEMHEMTNLSIAEQMTGCFEHDHGLGKAFAHEHVIVSAPPDIYGLLTEGINIHLPNASAGSYRGFYINYAGFDEVRSLENSSSAGDWSFGVRSDDTWYIAGQDNRFPEPGFSYWVNLNYGSFDSFEELCECEF